MGHTSVITSALPHFSDVQHPTKYKCGSHNNTTVQWFRVEVPLAPVFRRYYFNEVATQLQCTRSAITAASASNNPHYYCEPEEYRKSPCRRLRWYQRLNPQPAQMKCQTNLSPFQEAISNRAVQFKILELYAASALCPELAFAYCKSTFGLVIKTAFYNLP